MPDSPGSTAVIYAPDLSEDIPCLTIKLSCCHLESPPSGSGVNSEQVAFVTSPLAVPASELPARNRPG